MTTRTKALASSSPALVALLASLAWCALDSKGDARAHLTARGARLLDSLRL